MISIRQDLFNRQLSLVLSARKIGASRIEFINSGINYKSYGYYQQEPNVITLTLNYNINNYQHRRDDSGADTGAGMAPPGI